MLLWSFEGVPDRWRAFTISAVLPAGKHLFPFRTEKLSLPGPMVLGGQPPGRVGRRRLTSRSPPLAGFARFARNASISGDQRLRSRFARSCSGCRGLSASSGRGHRRGRAAPTALRCSEFFFPGRIEGAQPLHAFAYRWMRHEQRGESFFRERVHGVQRLGRRARGEGEELFSLLEANQ